MNNLPDDWINQFITETCGFDLLEDAMGLYWVVKEVRETLVDADDATVMEQSLRVVRAMLAAGLIAGTSALVPRDWQPWPDQRPDAVLARIRAQWQALGHEPTILDDPWFGPPRLA